MTKMKDAYWVAAASSWRLSYQTLQKKTLWSPGKEIRQVCNKQGQAEKARHIQVSKFLSQTKSGQLELGTKVREVRGSLESLPEMSDSKQSVDQLSVLSSAPTLSHGRDDFGMGYHLSPDGKLSAIQIEGKREQAPKKKNLKLSTSCRRCQGSCASRCGSLSKTRYCIAENKI